MNGHPLRLIPGAALTAVVASGLLLAASLAVAAEPEQDAVRNRYYKDAQRFEVTFTTGLSVANTLTAMYTPSLNIAYHIDEQWAIELIAGYAIGGVTSLQAGAQAPVSQTGANVQPVSVFKGANPNRKFNDLANLWTMNGFNAQLGARWEPVYGKFSVLTALPIHFKWYLDLDAGISQFTRNSLYYCHNFDTAANDCNKAQGQDFYDTVQGNRWSGLVSVGTGMRIIFLEKASLILGLREYFWWDTYQVGFTGADFVSKNNGTGGTTSHGITPTLFADFGLSWTF